MLPQTSRISYICQDSLSHSSAACFSGSFVIPLSDRMPGAEMWSRGIFHIWVSVFRLSKKLLRWMDKGANVIVMRTKNQPSLRRARSENLSIEFARDACVVSDRRKLAGWTCPLRSLRRCPSRTSLATKRTAATTSPQVNTNQAASGTARRRMTPGSPIVCHVVLCPHSICIFPLSANRIALLRQRRFDQPFLCHAETVETTHPCWRMLEPHTLWHGYPRIDAKLIRSLLI